MNDERMQRRVLEVGEPSNSNGLAMVLMKEKTATNNRQGKKSKANGARPGERRRRRRWWKRRRMVACPALGNEMSTSPPANGAVQGPLPGAHWPRRRRFDGRGPITTRRARALTELQQATALSVSLCPWLEGTRASVEEWGATKTHICPPWMALDGCASTWQAWRRAWPVA